MAPTSIAGLVLPVLLSGALRAQYVDTTAHPTRQWHLAWYGVGMPPREPIWHGDSLDYDAVGSGGLSMGLEAMVRHSATWSFGIHVASAHSFVDAIHQRTWTSTGDGEWVVRGERMGLDLRFTTVGVQAAYEPWHYPRRHKVGMTAQLGAGLAYMHFSEKRFLIEEGELHGTSSYLSPPRFSYDTHDDMQVLDRSMGSGVCGQLWLRGELHFGRHFSMFADLVVQAASAFNAGGATHTTSSGTVLSIVPHRVEPGYLMSRAGFLVHFGTVPVPLRPRRK